MNSTPHYKIYKDYVSDYDLLRERMDYENNLLKQFTSVADFNGADVVEFAAGTGKITQQILPFVKSVKAYDLSEQMLNFAKEKLTKTEYSNWGLEVADNTTIPLPNNCADIIIEGWSLGYMVAAARKEWKTVIDKVLHEMMRLLKDKGTIIIAGTLGTGAHNPKPPNKELENLYHYLEKEKGFSVTPWFKTDYKFQSVEEAEKLVRFFWSDGFGDYIKEKKLTILPECTAIWYWEK